jgi:uncharacterized SAM-binding protein YcdF (DUF218 family)
MTTSTVGSGADIQARRQRRSGWRIVLSIALCFAALAAASWIERFAIAREAASLWIVSDAPEPADAAAVFGGGLEYRPFAAADYYRRGLVPKILVSNIGSSPAERLGVLQPHVKANVEVLRKLGVPETAVEAFGSDLKDTYAEAEALHEWALRTGARKILVPTDIFASRRLRWILHRAFGNDAITLVPAVDVPDYTRNDWWQNENGVITFQNEVIKYAYYRLKY